jgi:hypothetical protein
MGDTVQTSPVDGSACQIQVVMFPFTLARDRKKVVLLSTGTTLPMREMVSQMS